MQKKLKWKENCKVLSVKKKLQKSFGELNHLGSLTRPNSSFSVNLVARRMQDGTKEAYRTAKWILVNVVGTWKQEVVDLQKLKNKKRNVVAIFDAAFAGIKDVKSGGMLILVNENLVA